MVRLGLEISALKSETKPNRQQQFQPIQTDHCLAQHLSWCAGDHVVDRQAQDMYGRGDARLWFLRHRDLHDSLFMERRLRRSRRVQARIIGDLWQLRITDLYVVVQLGRLRGTQICGNTCDFGPCTGATGCAAGTSEACGNCNQGTRTCSTTCGWGACTGAGVCAPGDKEACAGGGSKTCGTTCAWGGCPTTCDGTKIHHSINRAMKNRSGEFRLGRPKLVQCRPTAGAAIHVGFGLLPFVTRKQAPKMPVQLPI